MIPIIKLPNCVFIFRRIAHQPKQPFTAPVPVYSSELHPQPQPRQLPQQVPQYQRPSTSQQPQRVQHQQIAQPQVQQHKPQQLLVQIPLEPQFVQTSQEQHFAPQQQPLYSQQQLLVPQ